MSRNTILLLALLTLTPVILSAQIVHKVLFLGNSYTYSNNLPGIIQSLAEAGGDSLYFDSNTPGGYQFQQHVTNATTLSRIAQDNWDYVIMQEQSQIPSFPQGQVQQICYPHAATLCDSIRSNDPCSEPLFFMTWGRENGDAQNCPNWPPVCTFLGMAGQLRMSYLNMANWNNATVAPAGVAWVEARNRDPQISLYTGDGSHPNYTGSYLTACVFYATMYRKAPTALNFYGSLDTATATFLQTVAEDVVFDSLDIWRIGHRDVYADFDYVLQSNGDIAFSDSSANATQWAWDFGDGATDSIQNPAHTYTTSGTYTVTLIVTDGCNSDTISDTVNVVVVGRDLAAAPSLQLWPNPATDLLQLEMSALAGEAYTLTVRDLQGRVLRTETVTPSSGYLRHQIRTKALPAGTYLLEIRGASTVVTQKFIRK
ncbi:MAG: PKD domain-containing protein [Bacteroidota bacterium]